MQAGIVCGLLGLLRRKEEKIGCPTGRSKTGSSNAVRAARPTRQEAERRHRSLIETAFRLFLDKGWEGASIDEISRRAGVAKGFIYARYPDKAALFVGAIERLMEDAMGTLQVGEPLPDDVEEGLLRLRPEALGPRAEAGSAGIPSPVHRGSAEVSRRSPSTSSPATACST